MHRYYLEITVQVRDAVRDQMESVFDRVADALYDLPDIIDADLGSDVDKGTLEFSMAVDADDAPAALEQGLVAVRCAIHVAGGTTAGWESHFETIQNTVRTEDALVDA